MSYLDSLDQCVATLETCNNNLAAATTALGSLTRTFPRVSRVIRCETKYELTTASDIGKAQSLISKEAVPFLFRQVDQLESAVEVIRATHEAQQAKVEQQKSEYQQLVEDEATMVELQKVIKDEQSALSDAQANLLNLKSTVAAKERELAEHQRTRSGIKEDSEILEESAMVDAEIIRMRRTIADIDEEMAGIPIGDQLEDTKDQASKYMVLDNLRTQLLQCTEDMMVDSKVAEFMQGANATLQLLENRVFVPWWDRSSSMQSQRQKYVGSLFRYFFRDYGNTMQAILDTLLDHQSMTVEELKRELMSVGHSTEELPMLLRRLSHIQAVTTETKTENGQKITYVRLDFSSFEDAEPPQQEQ
ncbi:hypothetical protein DL89DRAFT_165220 [Linderina pennispora]|uniref:Uncharacterized protein n=1 Tax=Linderina pennispora TaxID=61395 RepID=A0A1Y1W8K0_9FUNG|nr:uncharacterized protein DL89DRAFT_165220 [Linderina pennispora]ORX69725.1 hypothetical protein DL89DRAFT_165220 [Linderina pennispora]